MGQLFAPRAFGSKKCVVRAFVVRPDGHSRFSFSSAEASRNLGFLRGFEKHSRSVRVLVLQESWGFYAGRRYAGGLGPSRVRTRIPQGFSTRVWFSSLIIPDVCMVFDSR